MGKLMIMGAGIYQVPLIKKAKEMGHFIIVVSNQGNYPGFELADKIYYESTTHTDKILLLAQQEQIDGICTTGTDVAVATIGKVADMLKIKGISYEAAQRVNNKLRMKEAFLGQGVRTALFYKINSLAEAYTAYQELQKPVMFKAVDSSGSRGIVKVENKEEIIYAYEKVRKVTKVEYFIVEEFIEGTEFGVQAFIYDGCLIFILAHGDIVFKGDAGVPIGHYVPYHLSEEVMDDMKRQIGSSIIALGIDNCAINIDLILSNNKVYILEIGARAGATCLVELVSIYHGIDYYENIINAALGIRPSINSRCTVPSASILLVAEKTGKIVAIRDENKEDPNIVDISLDYKLGDVVEEFRVGPDRIGQVIVKGSNIEDTLKLLYKVKENIRISIS